MSQPISPDPSGDRPFPDFVRNAHTVRVFALVVGINDYPGQIPKLSGCLKDVSLVENYLRSRFGDDAASSHFQDLPLENAGAPPVTIEQSDRLHLCVLTDQAATYSNIVRAFREHLSLARENDTVWFHFSGHGAEQFAAPEFLSLDPNGKDQTLVCYRDPAAAAEPLFLADKELAVLLHELDKNKPHIVVSLDTCHSGSGTRELEEEPGISPRVYKFLTSADREDPSLLPGSVRAFDSYLGGYYQELDQLDIPTSKHVLLSACESVQTAGDTVAGGVFTTSLIETLSGISRPIHYAELFTRTRARANKKNRKQNPQFESINGFDPYTCFLEGIAMDNIGEFYEVFVRGNSWYAGCGAIHGLPVGSDQAIKLMIISDIEAISNGAPAKVGAFIDKVGAQHSKIRFKEGEEGILDANKQYFAEVLSMPAAPVYVDLTGDNTGVTKLQRHWDASKNILHTALSEESEPPFITVEALTDGGFRIFETATGKSWIEIPTEAGSMDERIALVQEKLNRIVRWKRTIALDNSASKIRDLFEFKLLVTDKNFKPHTYGPGEVTIIGTEENLRRTPEGNDLLGINFQITLKQAKQDLYVYGFDLLSSCAIRFMSDQEEVLRVENLNPGAVLPLRSTPYGWGLGPNDQEAVRWFKVFVTTEELDYHRLEQKGLLDDRDIDEAVFAPEKISEDWCAETVKVTLVRG